MSNGKVNIPVCGNFRFPYRLECIPQYFQFYSQTYYKNDLLILMNNYDYVSIWKYLPDSNHNHILNCIPQYFVFNMSQNGDKLIIKHTFSFCNEKHFHNTVYTIGK